MKKGFGMQESDNHGMPDPASPLPLADLLKSATSAQHLRTERHPFEVRMISGGMTAPQYAVYLRQMLPVQHALGAALQSRAADPAFATLIQPYHFHAERVKADLAALGEKSEGQLLPATANFVALIARAAADVRPWLLGVWYVLEGSTNGGRFIARALAKVFGPGVAISSMDPHGELTTPRWHTWRAGLNALRLSEHDRQAIFDAAGQTFDAMYDMLEDIELATATPKLQTTIHVTGPTPIKN
jgi:heme oxygenase